MKNIAIIVAGGKGKRMGEPKQFLKLAGKPMLAWTVDVFQRTKAVDGIILVVAADQLTLAKRLRADKIIAVVPGGKERQDSVRNGLAVLPKETQVVIIHDGARPAVTPDLINDTLKEVRDCGAAIVGVPVKDTIKKVHHHGPKVIESETIDRAGLWAAQTPQTFTAPIIRKAYDQLKEAVTDDAMAVEKLGIKVKMVMGSYTNLKVTTPEDIQIMTAILKGRQK
ncbi:MAG: 2-C-methyl-D-erythritol 4-phosphate cytidylyltransferase [Candidatus Margulisbacteria bacterium]|jgi:2-C-methyl-D-erythritol 4-phosphate cytidylyltransferase|nr:2-C-methyl-D-erythritol 4-phosphate cytidylyltransferase [Candidatus Margulisiibacteriota bacterium]